MRFYLISAAVLALLTTGVGIWLLNRPQGVPSGERRFVLVVSGDTGGWIMPCGCASNQSGGLLRRGSYVAKLRRNAELVVADVGGAPGGTSAYQRVKFEAILRGELRMGLNAHNLGGPEAALGAEYLRQVEKDLKIPFVSANLRDQNKRLVTKPLRVVERAGLRTALAGVLSQDYEVNGVIIDEPHNALLKAITSRRDDYDRLVVLAYLPEEELKQLAGKLPEAYIIVGGPTGQAITPRRVGPTWVGSATNKGKFLVQMELSASSADNPGAGKVVEMDSQWSDQADQLRNLKDYLAVLEGRDFSASETGLAPIVPENAPSHFRLAGDKSCAMCHSGDCHTLASSKHAHAWETLTQRGFHVDSYCQQCHTNGFGLPGGFTSVRRTPQRINVGCETCHGPSLAHAQNPSVATLYRAKDRCVLCHDLENSPQFEYASYWTKIDHGEKLKR